MSDPIFNSDDEYFEWKAEQEASSPKSSDRIYQTEFGPIKFTDEDPASIIKSDDEEEEGKPPFSTKLFEPLKLVPIRAQEFASREYPAQKWLVRDLFSAQTAVSMIVGESGSFKTWVAIELARCVSLGQPFFGFDVPEEREVMYFNLEMPEALIQERALGRFIDQEFRGKFRWVHSPSRPINLLNTADFIEVMRIVNEDPQPGLIILDTLSKLHGGDAQESDNDKMTELILYARRLAEAAKGLVIILHHTSKYNPEFPKPKLERIRGASALRDNMLNIVFLASKRSRAGEIFTEGELVKSWSGEVGVSFRQKLVVEKDEETGRIAKAEWQEYDDGSGGEDDPVWDEILERLWLFFAPLPEGLGLNEIPHQKFRGSPKTKNNPDGALSYAASERLSNVLKEMENQGLVRVARMEGKGNRKMIYKGELW